ALATGEVDAIVSVINAPARLFQRLAARPGIRLVPLEDQAIAELAGRSDSLVPLVLPVGTYPRQAEAIPTVAVTALLVAREAMPEIEVTAILDTVFDEIDFMAAGSAAGALISRSSAAIGLSIPLHPAAEAYFDGTPAATPQSAPQPTP
ncbi:MAG TPA: TAXI family TRAP transporter solute-binding subunit, partial [Arenibaculum sp.]|nr:TAXI family TRAP transporter solute-binding subunit [Arenibaculum sp.]